MACTDCAKKKLGATAASSYDLLVKWGTSPELAAAIVELGVFAVEDSDQVSVLSTALSASLERVDACKEALDEAELEVGKLQEELQELENTYNDVVEAFEGSYQATSKEEEVGDAGDEGEIG